jgi:hypothetical protein
MGLAELPDSPDGNQQREAETAAQQDVGFHFKVLEMNDCVSRDAPVTRRFNRRILPFLPFRTHAGFWSRQARPGYADQAGTGMALSMKIKQTVSAKDRTAIARCMRHGLKTETIGNTISTPFRIAQDVVSGSFQ